MSGFAEYDAYDALGLAELIRDKEVTPEEVLEAAIARVEARNPAYNAVVTKLYDLGRTAIADGLPDGPLRGVPYALKELGSSLAGVPTTRGSRFFADLVPPADSEHVKRLKRAGLVIFGKTNTCELGASLTCEPQLHGASRNPWDSARTPSGSSGGAAAAVAARMVPAAHASDGFGSIRAPAASCGLVGLKPTRARNTFAPFLGEGLGGLAQEHAVSLTVRDNAALLDATAGPGLGDPYVAPAPARPYLEEVGAPPGRLRIAFTTRTPHGEAVEAEPLRVLRDTAALCESLGHDVEEADPDIEEGLVQPTFRIIIMVQTVVTLEGHPSGHLPGENDVETITRLLWERGKALSGADGMRASMAAHRLGRQMAAFHERYDVLLTPGLATAPPELGWLDMMMEDFDEYWRRVAAFSPFTVWVQPDGSAGHDAAGGTLGYRLAGRSSGCRAIRRRSDTISIGGPNRGGAALDRSPALRACRGVR